MNLTEIVPVELIPMFAWLGKQNWLTYKMGPDNRTEIALPKIVQLPGDEQFCQSAVRFLSQVPDGIFLETYAVSKAFAQGPKVIRATSDQCHAFEHVDVDIPFSDYVQPYPAVFIELPSEYRDELAQRFSCPAPKYVLSFHDERTGYIIMATYGSSSTHVLGNLSPRPYFATIEESLRHSVDTGSDIDQSEVAKRIALNFCLTLVAYGVRVIGKSNPHSVKKLTKLAHHRRKAKADRAKLLLDAEPTVIAFQQEIKLVAESDEADSGSTNIREHGNESKPRTPHWRRGYYRRQRIGPGRTELKLIFIRPVLVNRSRFGGDEKDTTVVYC